jgi:serine/threonine protein kinase
MPSGDEKRDRRAEEILDAALKLPPDQIEEFIASECGPDAELLAAVHGRLDALHTVYSAAAAEIARPASESGEKHSPPTILGHYRIREKIGQGGMGAVFLAVDTHLDRLVAVKVLPPKSVRDPERRRRFEREAKHRRRRLYRHGIRQGADP